MKKTIALILMVVGGTVMAFGGYRAATVLSGLYQSNLNDALGQPDGSEQAASKAMIRGVTIGAVGVPVFLTGRIMWMFARRRNRLTS
jgi:hypothetical protein